MIFLSMRAVSDDITRVLWQYVGLLLMYPLVSLVAGLHLLMVPLTADLITLSIAITLTLQSGHPRKLPAGSYQSTVRCRSTHCPLS